MYDVIAANDEGDPLRDAPCCRGRRNEVDGGRERKDHVKLNVVIHRQSRFRGQVTGTIWIAPGVLGGTKQTLSISELPSSEQED